MKDVIFDDFQDIVSETLLRHRSIIDITSKLLESEARINRAVAKSITGCGCLEVDAKKQGIPANIPEDITLEEFNKYMDSHVKGELCPACREVLEKEIGNNLFYLASLCNTLNLNMYDIFLKEYNDLKMLGKYHMR
jgi:hypothetical protein